MSEAHFDKRTGRAVSLEDLFVLLCETREELRQLKAQQPAGVQPIDPYYNLKEAADYANCDEDTLKKIFKSAGTPLKKPYRIKQSLVDKAIEKYNQANAKPSPFVERRKRRAA
jgi:hypothetical protein